MNAAKEWKNFSLEQLQACREELEQEYAGYVKQNLKLNMSRGKPAGTQLDLCNGALETLSSYTTADGLDARNYGVLDGLPEVKKLFSDLLDIPAEKIIVGGNSSLNLMTRWSAVCCSARGAIRRGASSARSNSSVPRPDTTAISPSARNSGSK